MHPPSLTLLLTVPPLEGNTNEHGLTIGETTFGGNSTLAKASTPLSPGGALPPESS